MSDRMPPRLSADDQIQVCLRELDHLQAIVGRYDTFFFWGKNLCLVAIGSGIWLTAEGHFSLPLLIEVPIFFFLVEVTFRWSYWTPKIARVDEIRNWLNTTNGTERSGADAFRFYRLKATRQRCPLEPYDLVFYTAVVIALLGFIIVDCYCNVFHLPR